LTSSLAQFLASVDKKAYKMANIATLNSQDALDIVQDTMEKMVRYYSNKQPKEWPALFYRILHNNIMDFHRKKKFRNLFFFWQQNDEKSYDDHSAFSTAEDDPDLLVIKSENIDHMLIAIESLPAKQQQCFLLRCWQGFSVAKTAQIMTCSQGTIKTHYSRAVVKLKTQLENLDV
jgi:RNA polymerase sigma-70 factor (ECF subfamily)